MRMVLPIWTRSLLAVINIPEKIGLLRKVHTLPSMHCCTFLFMFEPRLISIRLAEGNGNFITAVPVIQNLADVGEVMSVVAYESDQEAAGPVTDQSKEAQQEDQVMVDGEGGAETNADVKPEAATTVCIEAGSDTMVGADIESVFLSGSPHSFHTQRRTSSFQIVQSIFNISVFLSDCSFGAFSRLLGLTDWRWL